MQSLKFKALLIHLGMGMGNSQIRFTETLVFLDFLKVLRQYEKVPTF